jgi:chromosome partitioning protein
MFVVALVNRKGGCGKSTLATHLAAHFARQDDAQVGLCDLDRQQSAANWLKLRDAQALPDRSRLRAWQTSARTLVRPTTGWSHLVLDTPGGMEAMDLARVVMAADVVLLPLRDSLFDRLATEQCVTELRRLPRVAQGRCRLALVGIGLPNEARGRETDLTDWAQAIGLPLAGGLRETAAYGRCPEKGLSVFDRPSPRVRQIDLPQWEPIFNWLTQAQDSAAKQPRGETRTVLAAMRLSSGRGPAGSRTASGSPAASAPHTAPTGPAGVHAPASSPVADDAAPSGPALEAEAPATAQPPSATPATQVATPDAAPAEPTGVQRLRTWWPHSGWLTPAEQR